MTPCMETIVFGRNVFICQIKTAPRSGAVFVLTFSKYLFGLLIGKIKKFRKYDDAVGKLRTTYFI